jgi:hypothetical protein
MLTITTSGSFAHTESFLKAMQKLNVVQLLHQYGLVGVAALSSATPINSGVAASSWSYRAGKKGSFYFIDWYNSDVENGFPVVIMLQFGHGTRNGGYVQGRDFINPAIRPIFDQIEADLWKAVTSA